MIAGMERDDTAKITNPQMVVCMYCRLLLGWSERPSETVCITCFDGVEVIRTDELKRATTETGGESSNATNAGTNAAGA